MTTNNEFISILSIILITIKDALLGGVGGVVAYIYDYSKKRNTLGADNVMWSNSAMIINAIIGAFVANSLGSFITNDMTGRDGIISFIGISSYAILGIVESRFATFILNRTLGMANGKNVLEQKDETDLSTQKT
jgi:hypothetical protein